MRIPVAAGALPGAENELEAAEVAVAGRRPPINGLMAVDANGLPVPPVRKMVERMNSGEGKDDGCFGN